ncbi:class I SAM-dependent DNA methyltransferase [Allorhizobium taibaishanense]|uniref:Methyltransferase n=1 Tax=Allorhizobium taibaishanense TaxID=887144 RepID=A0A1Q9A953_9HYPH|nr:methyltransferase domain-containing protein [Allorhizobium taibaishanense]MBB4009379.1 putative TPR repeat methyltransferase [Allorhizobium taibaishanense]OLP51071.1 methyltransferase [Allorhizobium taibaishanense]
MHRTQPPSGRNAPGSRSSGDVTADRRADYARMLAESGDHAAAAELMEQALELAPGWAAGWFLLGDYRMKAADPTAADAYRQVLALDPQDIFGAGLKLVLLGAEAMPEKPPSRYVEALFDDYADRFDAALVERLDYRVPKKLAALIARVTGPDRRHAHAVDLGCGTGLMGAELRPQTDYLEGYDLSAAMLAKARDKQIYDALGEADLSLPPETCGLFPKDKGSARADLVTAADVLMYLGNLTGVFTLAADLLRPGGYFAFSVERHEGEEGFSLAPSLRYQHGQAYVEAELRAQGFELLTSEQEIIRLDGGKPIQGLLFIARKPA